MLRNRLVALLMGVMSLGVVVAMVPSGGAAAGQQNAAARSPACTQAKKVQSDALNAVGPYLTAEQNAAYASALNTMVSQACTSGTLTCETAQALVAQLRAIRGNSLPPSVEAQIRGLEDQLLALLCSS